MKNFWLQRRGKRKSTREINFLLAKFIGRKSTPINLIFAVLKKTVLKYFKQYPENAKFFVDEFNQFDYDIDIMETNGIITDVKFIPLT